MNERLEAMKQRVRDGEHHRWRQQHGVSILAECEAEHLPWEKRAARLTRRQCETEHVIIQPDERIVFTRTLPAPVPRMYDADGYARITAGRLIHELSPINNICADWGSVLADGLLGRREAALCTRERLAGDPQAVLFLDCLVETIDAVLDLAGRYAAEARRLGRADLAEMLDWVPANPPRTFHEALQALRLLQAVLWLSSHNHVGFGRFDQYMWPYLRTDLESGRLNEETAAELLAEFFISLNKDSDLYPGVQQGDNGQSMTLGGVDSQGNVAINPLTWMVLAVTRDLAMIDPKINLRINSHTSLDLLSLASELTRKGLGFPQYSNDDVVIPGLIAHGYAPEDARNYAIAACWEFLIPGRGMDVVNIGAVSFPAAADRAIRSVLQCPDQVASRDFESVLQRVEEEIRSQVNMLAHAYEDLLLPPAPYYSALMSGCIERGRDLSRGAVYNNYGIHGAGSANAADALAAVEQFVFQERRVAPGDLLAALETDFAGQEELRCLLSEEGHKTGNDDERADRILIRLFEALASACEDYGKTSRGGILRPGTGSAMYYVWLAQGREGIREPVVGATAEGRHKGQPLGANLAPTQGVQIRGPFSVLQTFAKIDYRRICNGGPITMELSDTVFRGPDSIRKVAMLVRAFAQLGCQQMQLNSLNVATLLEAKAHPELHKNLIVRVWGWSGYFCELSPEYQDQIIARHMYAIN